MRETVAAMVMVAMMLGPMRAQAADLRPRSASEVTRTVRARFSSIRACHELASRRAPLPGGKVTVRFRIVASGAVDSVEVAAAPFAGTTLPTCVASAVRRLQFAPSSGAPFQASYPIVF